MDLIQESEKTINDWLINEGLVQGSETNEELDAYNRLNTYVSNMTNQIYDKDKLIAKLLETHEKEKIEDAIIEANACLNERLNRKEGQYQEKLKEVEAVCEPIIAAVYRKMSHISASYSLAEYILTNTL